MELTVDCALNQQQWLVLQNHGVWAQWLQTSQLTLWNKPLEAVLCEQSGLQAMPDYPIAPIAAQADGLLVGQAYWLRADPVHLLLQHDGLSLVEPIPLEVPRERAIEIVASLNQHFSDNGLQFFIGHSGAWYLCLQHPPQLQTSLPSMAVGKNNFDFLPQGADASRWRAWLNEMQMLLHHDAEHGVVESADGLEVNSLWLSGGGVLPQFEQSSSVDLVVASDVLYQGLALGLAVPHQLALQQAGFHFQAQRVRMQLNFNDFCNSLPMLLRRQDIRRLRVNFGLYGKTLSVESGVLDGYKFWRRLFSKACLLMEFSS